MMSIAFHDHQRDVLPCDPVVGHDIIRYGSENCIIAFLSSYSTVLTHSSVRSCFPLLYHPCRSLLNVSGVCMLSIRPISPVSFPALLTHQPHSVQLTEPYNLIQHYSIVSCASKILPSTPYLSESCRSVQLFINSIRNTTISIHIDSTSPISDLKHLIYAHDGIPPCDLRLMHRGRALRDDTLLSGLDMDGGTITCLLRVLGGNPYGQIPLYWWFGFSRSYEDGRAGEEGRICYVLSEIEFGDSYHRNWYSDRELSDWYGIRLHSGIVLFVV